MTGSLRRDKRAPSADDANVAAPADEAADLVVAPAVDPVDPLAPPTGEAVDAASAATREAADEAADPAAAPTDEAADLANESPTAEAGTATTGVEASGEAVAVQWLPAAPIRKGYGGSAVSFALAGLVTSFFVGWAFPLALVGITLGIIAVRKPEESSRLGAWGIALGTLATIYSAGWLWWAGTQLQWFA